MAVKDNAPTKKTKKSRSYFKELRSEVKKISWPTFGKVMQQLGVVLAVIVLFTVVLFAIDLGLSELLKLLVG